MNKKTQIPQILEAIDIADKAEVGFGGNFIFGDPAETQQTIMETLSFYFQHCRDVFVFMNLLMPYPGSALFDYCVEHGIITDKVRFYEEIEKNRFNMTSIPLEQWFMWVNYIRITEEAWLFPKTIDADWWQREDGFMFQVHATCPHCGKQTWYRQGLSEEQLTNPKLYIGPGCVHCNKKLRINMTMETRRDDDCYEGREEDNRGTGIRVEGGRAEKEILHAGR